MITKQYAKLMPTSSVSMKASQSRFLDWARSPNRRHRTGAVHAKIFHWANLLYEDGVGAERAFIVIRAMADAVREHTRFVPDREILAAIRRVYSGEVVEGRPSAPRWPAVSKTLQAECKRLARARNWTLETLRATSPQDCEKMPSRAVLARLLGTDVLVCVGQSAFEFSTAPLDSFEDLGKSALIVPSAMSALTGARLSDGEQTAHSLSNTGPRQNLIVEFDDGATIDEQAARLIWLSQQRDLRAVVHSGNKSLHGWFKALDTEADDAKFFGMAIKLGADPALYLKSQFARMPNGSRDNGNKQQLEYLK